MDDFRCMGKISVGDWVTQYRSGYWVVKELHPKFSAFEQGAIHKGDFLGYYAVLQKAFGSTFKFGMAVDTCDVSLCAPVSNEQLDQIETYFAEHPKDKLKFESAEVIVAPSITTVYLQIDEKQQECLSAALDKLLPTLTLPKLRGLLAEQGLSEVLPGADNTYLYLYGYPWDLDANFDFQYFKYAFARK